MRVLALEKFHSVRHGTLVLNQRRGSFLKFQFSDNPISYERSKLAEAKTQRELKEMLYYDAIKLFSQGKIWEEGIKLCKELEHQYEHETFQYAELAKLLVSP